MHRGKKDREIKSEIEATVSDGFGLNSKDLKDILNDFSKKACNEETRNTIIEKIA